MRTWSAFGLPYPDPITRRRRSEWRYLQSDFEAPTRDDAMRFIRARFADCEYYHIYEFSGAPFNYKAGEDEPTQASRLSPPLFTCPECERETERPENDYLCKQCRNSAHVTGDGDNDGLPRYHYPAKSTV
jgi:hypothetical protein